MGKERFCWTLGLIAFALVNLASPTKGLSADAGINWGLVEKEAVSLLSRYIQIDTTNPPGNEIKAARFFKSILNREGIAAKIFESAPGRGNVYARVGGEGSKKALILMNHMDVVPADRRYWREDPFRGVVKGGYVWGRGALDMKGPAIVELMTMLMLKRQGIPLKRDVIFLGTADEEAGGAKGLGFMVKKHFALFKNAEFALNEGGRIKLRGDAKVPYYSVGVAEKGPFWLKMTVKGTPGHGSTPKSNSAVNKLVAALNRVINHRTPLKVVPEVQRFYAQLADLEASPKRGQLKNLRRSLKDPVFAAEFTRNPRNNASVRNTISVTMLEGSSKINVIPSEASARLDVRLLPGEDPEKFLTEIRRVVADPSIKVEPILSISPISSSTHSELFRIISGVARGHDPRAVITTPLLRGFTDCHYLRERGLLCYGFIPFKKGEQESSLIHRNDERVSVENLKFGIRMLYEIVRRLVAR
ncbi:MAG: M20/M25/M40 family metallo-hydrolase [Candidatus Binatia bacterium]